MLDDHLPFHLAVAQVGCRADGCLLGVITISLVTIVLCWSDRRRRRCCPAVSNIIKQNKNVDCLVNVLMAKSLMEQNFTILSQDDNA